MSISQREARRLKKRVEELENDEASRRTSWASEWPRGVHLDTIKVNDVEAGIIATARKLKHAVVLVPDKDCYVLVYGCPLVKQAR